MKILKFLVVLFSIFGLLVFSYGYLNEYEVLDTIFEYYNRTPSTLVNNEYKKDGVENFFVTKTDDFEANSKQDIMNIYYTVIYSGMNDFTFYCHEDYLECNNDVIKLNNEISILSQMNNFVNVFNTFKSVKTTYTSTGKVSLSIDRVYSYTDIANIKEKAQSIYNNIIKNNNNTENIKILHDYIINNTKYNVEEENSNVLTDSSTAIGPLFNGLATCNGYTDAMSIFLDMLNIPNVRISNKAHIWNLVYINDKWLHLDLTWDDPVNNLNKDMLEYDYFLKTSDELIKIDKSKNQTDHEFDKKIYSFINKYPLA